MRISVDRLASTTVHARAHLRQRRPGVLPRPDLRLHLAERRGVRRRRRVHRRALVADRRAAPDVGDDGEPHRRRPSRRARGAVRRARRRPGPTGRGLRPDAPVLGVDACPAGWVGVVLDPTRRTVRPRRRRRSRRWSRSCARRPTSGVVAIDIPIGLPDSGGRLADAEARRELVGKGSSVFSTSTRAAYEARPTRRHERPTCRDRGPHQRQRPGLRPAREDPRGRRLGAVAPRRRGDRGPSRGQLRPDGRLAAAGAQEGPGRCRARREALPPTGSGPAVVPRGRASPRTTCSTRARPRGAPRATPAACESFPAEPEIFSDGIPAAIRV